MISNLDILSEKWILSRGNIKLSTVIQHTHQDIHLDIKQKAEVEFD